ncbi:MAG: hypothetical protein EHM42_05895, partial [Planctomycetaceae bacterium]
MLTSRQRAIRRIGWLLLFLLFVRGVFDAIRYETGPETIEQHLFDCSFGWLGRNQDRLFALPVTQRADFWEREVLRRPSDEVETGVSTMRRARLIDKIVELEHALDPSRVDLPEPLPIDDRLHIECVRLALRATELTPDDPEVWRDAALLCAHSARRNRLPSLAGFTFDELLKRASTHDSGNGLYQILEAVGESIPDDMMRNSGNLRSIPMTFPGGSDTSRTLLLQGLAQPQLAGGERLELDGIHLAVRLPISRSDQVNLAMGMRWPWRFTALVKVLTQRLCEEGASEPEVNLNRSQSRARRTLQLRRLTEQLCSAGDRSLKMSILFDATL